MSNLKHIKTFEARSAGIYQGGLTDLAIEALEKKKNTTAFKILEYIQQSGEMGRSHTEIVKFILSLKGRTYNHETDRGYYATNLYGSDNRPFWIRGESKRSNPGLYELYCEKTEDGRWKLNTKAADFFDEQEGVSKFSKDIRKILSRL
jgi:hypothetical protein